jgi:phage repressor protein C with HTH and peptisase S24 domain
VKLPVCFYRVQGSSMLPTFRHGDTLIGWRWGRPRVGRIVVAIRERPLVKRIVRINAGEVWLEGDNATGSTDSRHFGPLPISRVEATIVGKLG